jgi:hypothetical protein
MDGMTRILSLVHATQAQSLGRGKTDGFPGLIASTLSGPSILGPIADIDATVRPT